MNALLSRSVLFWGVLDLGYIAWSIFMALSNGNVPFYTNLMHDIGSAKSFEEISSSFLVVGAHAASISIMLSGVLMILNKKVGVYLSLAQAPFRIFLVIPPTFFFVMFLKSFLPPANLFILIAFVYLLEAAKIYFQIRWLRIQQG